MSDWQLIDSLTSYKKYKYKLRLARSDMRLIWVILAHKITIAAFWFACLGTQLLKMIIISLIKRKFVPVAFWELAGMPSTHTAVSTAGLFSLSFEVSRDPSHIPILLIGFALSFVAILSVLTVERAVAKHAELLNRLCVKAGEQSPQLRERWGHTPLEVLTGAAWGALIAIVVHRLF